MVIKKKGSGFVAATKSGRPLSKKVQTKAGAKAQLAAVEANKGKK